MADADIAAPQGTEATPTTNEPAVAPEAPAAPATPVANIPADQIEAFNRFIEGNGGYEKAFAKLKSAVSAPKTEEKPAEPAPEAKAPEAPAAPAAPVKPEVAEGYITPTEIAAIQYNRMLAESKGYENISDYINDGKYLEEMRAMGMSPVDMNGNMNDRTIRMFLDMKSKTMPAVAPTTPSTTTTPTASYVEVGDKIEDMDTAMKVLGQNNHPKHAEAVEFMRKSILKR